MANDIETIKLNYGQSAERIIASGIGLVNKGKRYHCCNIYQHSHGDQNPSMSWDPKALHFYCFTCGMKIDIYGYYRDHLNYSHQEVIRELLGTTDYRTTSMQTNRDTFSQELLGIKPITQECIDYIQLRGITEETIEKFKVKSCRGNIAFPYFKYETIVGYKLRKPMKDPPKPKLTSLTGSKPYLFNAQNVVMGSELIICEGEFDCMVIDQCGYTNVVSVGAGANSMSTLIDQSKEFLDKFEILIIVSDNDESGTNMDKTFVEMFGEKAKLIDKKLYVKNDINEEYIINHQEKIIQLIESARFKIEGRRDLDKDPYRGLKSITGRYISTGLVSIDYAINDLAPGCVTLIAGRSNGGKTTLTKQIIANAIDKENKVYLMSGEGNTEKLINEIYQCVIGRANKYYDIIRINKRYHKEPKPEILETLKRWHKNKFTVFNKGESKLKTIDQLFKMVEVEIKLNKFDLVVIDNLMSILSVQSSEKMEAQADFLQRCHDLANLYHTHIILVLHPNKTYKKGDDMDFEQISGSSDISNKADNIISVIREYDVDENKAGISGKICVLKNRYYPDLITCNVHFEEQTGLLLEIDKLTTSTIPYRFHWDKYLDLGVEVDATADCPF